VVYLSLSFSLSLSLSLLYISIVQMFTKKGKGKTILHPSWFSFFSLLLFGIAGIFVCYHRRHLQKGVTQKGNPKELKKERKKKKENKERDSRDTSDIRIFGVRDVSDIAISLSDDAGIYDIIDGREPYT